MRKASGLKQEPKHILPHLRPPPAHSGLLCHRGLFWKFSPAVLVFCSAVALGPHVLRDEIVTRVLLLLNTSCSPPFQRSATACTPQEMGRASPLVWPPCPLCSTAFSPPSVCEQTFSTHVPNGPSPTFHCHYAHPFPKRLMPGTNYLWCIIFSTTLQAPRGTDYGLFYLGIPLIIFIRAQAQSVIGWALGKYG